MDTVVSEQDVREFIEGVLQCKFEYPLVNLENPQNRAESQVTAKVSKFAIYLVKEEDLLAEHTGSEVMWNVQFDLKREGENSKLVIDNISFDTADRY